MDLQLILFVLTIVFGFYMAFNIGANDVANAMGTSVGSGALTLKKAVIIAAILEFSGAFLIGSRVTQTLQTGIVHTAIFEHDALHFVYGMLGALLATGIWLQVASYFGWPVSTTHAIVGAILGFGIAAGGLKAILWKNVFFIATSWVLSPLFAGVLSYFIFSILQKTVLFSLKPIKATQKVVPIFVFFALFVLFLAVLFDGLKSLKFDVSWHITFGIAFCIGLVGYFLSKLLIRKKLQVLKTEVKEITHHPQSTQFLRKAMKHLQRVSLHSTGDLRKESKELFKQTKTLYQTTQKQLKTTSDQGKYNFVEKVFAMLQILSACFVAFAHGSNDVANAIGPVAAIVVYLKTNTLELSNVGVPIWVLAFGGVGIVIGLAVWGWRVIETVGKKITELTPTRGFCAEFSAAITILIATKLAMPVSTTQSLVGALLGVGLARGFSALNLKTIRDILVSWAITIPVSCILSMILFYLFIAFFP
ncbi:MAG: Low-affinity inorganic phosphate transporter 1 [Chlamydiae bacterium]|nr:Low-affinity inorganic phosphate transporter 1 [Chlamydiota bacterium]